MIVAIQQPEHLPWIGFFNKMAQSDLFVYLDNVQLKKRYFENRNRIKTYDGIKWLTVPVNSKGKYSQKIKDVSIDSGTSWERKYKGRLELAYRKSRFWDDIKSIVFPCLEQEYNKLIDLNLSLIDKCREYLKIETTTALASSLEVDRFTGSDIIFQICIKTDGTTYISGPDGRNYLKHEDFNEEGVKVKYHDFKHPVYNQLFGDFLSNMSIIDLIANMGPKSSHIVRECYKAGPGGIMSGVSN